VSASDCRSGARSCSATTGVDAISHCRQCGRIDGEDPPGVEKPGHVHRWRAIPVAMSGVTTARSSDRIESGADDNQWREPLAACCDAGAPTRKLDDPWPVFGRKYDGSGGVTWRRKEKKVVCPRCESELVIELANQKHCNSCWLRIRRGERSDRAARTDRESRLADAKLTCPVYGVYQDLPLVAKTPVILT